MSRNFWICCQLGAREHYAIPRALNRAGQLHLLITDAWVSPSSLIHKLPGSALKSLGDRYHADLESASIQSFTKHLIKFELEQRIRKTADWDRMIARNQWFQNKVIQILENIKFSDDENIFLFAYSYAALNILEYAKSRGWKTVLGQIDPGIREEEIVKLEQLKYLNLAPSWQTVPASYWQTWRQECELADQIMVNSQWSQQLLTESEMNLEKIKIVPLSYQAPNTANFVRTYPKKFTKERPLRVLFLGLISLRKGIAACLDAIQKLAGEPIEFWFVGTVQIDIPDCFKDHPQVRWFGAVPRSQTSHFYQEADVFLFPTLSDGFGLTQLEALAWQLPVIVSRNCGEVIQDKVNGVILDEVSGDCIAKELQDIQGNLSNILARLQAANSLTKFNLDQLTLNLQNLSE